MEEADHSQNNLSNTKQNITIESQKIENLINFTPMQNSDNDDTIARKI